MKQTNITIIENYQNKLKRAGAPASFKNLAATSRSIGFYNSPHGGTTEASFEFQF